MTSPVIPDRLCLPSHGRLRRRVAAAFFAAVLAATVMISVAPERAGAAGSPVMGSSSLNAAQIVQWFNASTRSPYRASVPIGDLVGMYLSEGSAAGVRADVAFVQSIVETGWFSFPAGGYVRPTDNNFGGIGAYGDGSRLFRAPDARTGVRGQMQLLRRYADANSNQYNIGHAPVVQLWNPASRYDVPGGTHGWAPTWGDMTGRWASSPTYATSIFTLYNSLRVANGLPAEILSTGTAPEWRAWEPLGGALVGGPDVASLGANQLDVYVRGTDDQLWHKWWTGVAWSGWSSLGGVLTSDPTVVVTGRNIHVFARGTDNQLWHRWWEAALGAWQPWEPLGGILDGGPDGAVMSGSLHVFVKGIDGSLHQRWWDGWRWLPWEDLGGVLTSDPSVVASAGRYLDVYSRATAGVLQHKLWNGVGWSGWSPLDGGLNSAPDASSWPGRIDVFVTGTDDQLWATSWEGSNRTGWQGRGGGLTSAPGAASWGLGRIDVFGRGTDGQLWHAFLA